MTLDHAEQDLRRRLGQRWRRRLSVLALLAGLGWLLITGYYFRIDVLMSLDLLWQNRGHFMVEYFPDMVDMVGGPPAGVPMELVLKGRFTLPVQVPVTVADVLVGNAVRQLRVVLPLIVLPALLLTAGGVMAAAVIGRTLTLVDPTAVRRQWPAIVVPALLAFIAGSAFGAAAMYYRREIFALLGL